MEKRQLAQALRQRQYKTGMVERRLIDSLSDDDIIESYVTCSHCGQKQITDGEQAMALRLAKNSQEFLAMCDKFASMRPHRSS